MDKSVRPVEVMIKFKDDCDKVSPAEMRLIGAHLGVLLQQIMCDVSEKQEDEQ